MNSNINFPQFLPSSPLREEPSAGTQLTLRQRTEDVFLHSSAKLQALFEAMAPQAAKDARHHLRVQQIAFEVQNEEWRQMLGAKTVNGRFALCICGGACTALTEPDRSE
jgi:hypothetical protein